MTTFHGEGDLLLARHLAGPEGKWFPGAVGFGDSMLPFFRPRDEVWFEPIELTAIRVGDVVTFCTKENVLITHRVVRIARRSETLVFLTKGDSRLDFDPWLYARQVIGRVRKIRKWDLTKPWWRWMGWFVAHLSYGQGIFYQHLARSRLNQLRHRMERQGVLPKVQLLPWFWVASNPFLSCTVSVIRMIYRDRFIAPHRRGR